MISVPINGGLSEQHVRQYDSKTIIKALEGSFNILSMKMFHDGRHKRLVLIAEMKAFIDIGGWNGVSTEFFLKNHPNGK